MGLLSTSPVKWDMQQLWLHEIMRERCLKEMGIKRVNAPVSMDTSMNRQKIYAGLEMHGLPTPKNQWCEWKVKYCYSCTANLWTYFSLSSAKMAQSLLHNNRGNVCRRKSSFFFVFPLKERDRHTGKVLWNGNFARDGFCTVYRTFKKTRRIGYQLVKRWDINMWFLQDYVTADLKQLLTTRCTLCRPPTLHRHNPSRSFRRPLLSTCCTSHWIVSITCFVVAGDLENTETFTF